MSMHTGTEGSRREFLEVLAEFDVPAYVRRAKRTHDAWMSFLGTCEKQRHHRLEFVRMRLAMLAAKLNHQWTQLDQLASLESGGSVGSHLAELYAIWRPGLRVSVSATTSRRQITGALGDLISSLESFNRKWRRYVDGLDFTKINSIRADYNNYFVCEKAAALQSEQLAAHGFAPLPEVGPEDVWQRYPLLAVPRIR